MSTTNYFKTALLLGVMTGLILVVGRALGGQQGMLLALAFAGGFQTPVIVLLLGWSGIIDRAFLRKYRKHALLVTAVIAAFMTPGDPTTMFLLWVPLYVLYELGGVLLGLFPARNVAQGLRFGRKPKPAPVADAPNSNQNQDEDDLP